MHAGKNDIMKLEIYRTRKEGEGNEKANKSHSKFFLIVEQHALCNSQV